MSTVNTPAEQRVVFNDIKWETYLALAAEENRPGKLIAYDQGVMEIMSPGMLHESVASLIERMVNVFTEEYNIAACGSGSTTFKRDDLECGFEADASYYIAHTDAIRGKDEIDLSIDPPPDLAIEVDITRSSLNKFSIYGSIGVPEIWRYDGQTISVYVRSDDERYSPADVSTVLPGFPFKQAARVLERRHEGSDTTLIRAFRSTLDSNAQHRKRT